MSGINVASINTVSLESPKFVGNSATGDNCWGTMDEFRLRPQSLLTPTLIACEYSAAAAGVSCVVSAWSDFSSCSKGCGGGQISRSRTVVLDPAVDAESETAHLYGDKCPALVEQQLCNHKACAVSCSVSEWSDYGYCSKPCGGEGKQSRTRHVLTRGAHGGAACVSPMFKETRRCNTKPCDNECVMAEWESFSSCSAHCGGGTQVRMRKVLKHGTTVRNTCGATMEERQCNTESCPDLPSPDDCKEPSNIALPSIGFASCTGSDEQPCSNAFDGSADKSWQPAADKPVSILIELKMPYVVTELRAPTLAEEMMVTVDFMDGREAQILALGNHTVLDSPVKIQKANISFAGLPASGMNSIEMIGCASSAVDCVASSWSTFTACSKACGGGDQERSRSVEQQATAGGASCGHLVEKRQCRTQPCSQGCTVSEWSPFSACTTHCSGGFQKRTRKVVMIGPKVQQEFRASRIASRVSLLQTEWDDTDRNVRAVEKAFGVQTSLRGTGTVHSDVQNDPYEGEGEKAVFEDWMKAQQFQSSMESESLVPDLDSNMAQEVDSATKMAAAPAHASRPRALGEPDDDAQNQVEQTEAEQTAEEQQDKALLADFTKDPQMVSWFCPVLEETRKCNQQVCGEFITVAIEVSGGQINEAAAIVVDSKPADFHDGNSTTDGMAVVAIDPVSHGMATQAGFYSGAGSTAALQHFIEGLPDRTAVMVTYSGAKENEKPVDQRGLDILKQLGAPAQLQLSTDSAFAMLGQKGAMVGSGQWSISESGDTVSLTSQIMYKGPLGCVAIREVCSNDKEAPKGAFNIDASSEEQCIALAKTLHRECENSVEEPVTTTWQRTSVSKMYTELKQADFMKQAVTGKTGNSGANSTLGEASSRPAAVKPTAPQQYNLVSTGIFSTGRDRPTGAGSTVLLQGWQESLLEGSSSVYH